jgi:hypothetical protein
VSNLSGLTLNDLWLNYIAIGGTASKAEVAAYARGLACPDSYQHNMIAQAINEHFMDRRRNRVTRGPRPGGHPRSLHDLGAAAWFGGSLMGAIGVNGGSKDVKDPAERAVVASAGWARWAPVAAVAIGAHSIGSIGIFIANRDRVRDQRGAGTNSAIKSVLTVAAIGTTVYSGLVGAKIAQEGSSSPVEGGTVPSADTPDNVAALQQQQRILQWATPALTAGIIILGAQQGEQQRASEQLRTRGWSTVKGAVNRAPRLVDA